MPLTIWNYVLSYKRKNYFSENGLFFQEITLRTEFPGSNFLLPTFSTGGKWDFEVANFYLLLLISNPEMDKACICFNFCCTVKMTLHSEEKLCIKLFIQFFGIFYLGTVLGRKIPSYNFQCRNFVSGII